MSTAKEARKDRAAEATVARVTFCDVQRSSSARLAPARRRAVTWHASGRVSGVDHSTYNLQRTNSRRESLLSRPQSFISLGDVRSSRIAVGGIERINCSNRRVNASQLRGSDVKQLSQSLFARLDKVLDGGEAKRGGACVGPAVSSANTHLSSSSPNLRRYLAASHCQMRSSLSEELPS